jgi:hypothetical protein
MRRFTKPVPTLFAGGDIAFVAATTRGQAPPARDRGHPRKIAALLGRAGDRLFAAAPKLPQRLGPFRNTYQTAFSVVQPTALL